jgi:hypothetical protein
VPLEASRQERCLRGTGASGEKVKRAGGRPALRKCGLRRIEMLGLLVLELICAAAGEDFAQDAVGCGVEFELEFGGCSAGLVHQGWIEEHGGAVDEWA